MYMPCYKYHDFKVINQYYAIFINQYLHSLFLKNLQYAFRSQYPHIINIWSGTTDISLTLKEVGDYIVHIFYVFGSLGSAGELVHKGKSMKIRPPRVQLHSNLFITLLHELDRYRKPSSNLAPCTANKSTDKCFMAPLSYTYHIRCMRTSSLRRRVLCSGHYL